MKRNRGQKRNISKSKLVLFVTVSLVFMFSSHVRAADEESLLTIKPNILWLSNDINLSVPDNIAYDSFLGSGEVWYKKWGVSTELIENDQSNIFSLPADSEYFNVDVKRKFGQNNNFNFEVGLGWQEFSIDSQLDASGPRLSLEGNYKLFKSFQLYGSTAYLPDLDDSISDNSASAFQIEAGLLYSPRSALSLRAGYRVFELDLGLGDSGIEDLGSTSGFLFGSDLSW